MSSPQVNRQWIYVKRPEGEVTSEHYELRNSEVQRPGEGQILIKAKYLSVDPYMRIQQASTNTWEKPHPIGQVQGGGCIGEVIESKDERFQVGDIVNAYTGWQEYAVVNGENARKMDPSLAPVSYGLGILGMPGRTAYFGLIRAGKPKEGETLVVSGAAGAVGSIVVQIGKILGLRVVGIAGSQEKIDHLVNELGCDAALNYKDFGDATQIRDAILQQCPNGVDIYWDNVGGPITDAIFECINVRARIIICGQISQYNGNLDNPSLGPRFLHHILYKRATIQGILARDFNNEMPEMLEQMGAWIKEGKIQYRETVHEGFENLPHSLNSLFYGKNTGKLVVKID